MLKTTSYLFLLTIILTTTKKTRCNYVNYDTKSNSNYGSYDTKNPGNSNCDASDYLIRHGYILLGNQYYYFSTVAETWHDASLFCQRHGSRLAHPLNKQENDYLRTYLNANYPSTKGWYFGANDILNEGHWVWYGSNTSVGFTDWGDTQPDNNGGAEHCAHYWKDSQWKWDDWWCYKELNFICQADLYTYKICS